jgi:hypothetical protein
MREDGLGKVPQERRQEGQISKERLERTASNEELALTRKLLDSNISRELIGDVLGAARAWRMVHDKLEPGVENMSAGELQEVKKDIQYNLPNVRQARTNRAFSDSSMSSALTAASVELLTAYDNLTSDLAVVDAALERRERTPQSVT